MIAFFALVLGSTQTGGPVIGGALTSRLSWRWCFWINLPLGGLSLLLGFFGGNIKDPESRRDGKTTKQLLKDFDIVGFAIWVPFVVCLTLILQFGGLRYTWSSGPLIALYVLTPLLLLMFIFSQRRGGDGALTPGRIMKQRSLACSALYVMSMHAARSQISYFVGYTIVPCYLMIKTNITVDIATHILPSCPG
jgi:MFS family permease